MIVGMGNVMGQYEIFIKNDSNIWITGSGNNWRHPSIAGVGGDTIYLRLDSSGFVKDVYMWVIQDVNTVTYDTVYVTDTLSYVFLEDTFEVLDIEAFVDNISPSVALTSIYQKILRLTPSINYDSLNNSMSFILNDYQPMSSLDVDSIYPSLIYWFKDGALIDSISGSSYFPSSTGYYWAQAKATYVLSNILSPDTFYYNRLSKPSDTIFVNPIIYPVQCIQSVATTIQNSSSDSTADGAVYLTINGGTPPYSFLWNNSSTQQNLVNVLPDYYSVQISSSDTACPVYYLCANVTTLDDTSTVIPDTIYTSVIDTCLGFSVVNYYVSDIITVGDTSTIIWVFVGANDVAIIASEYYQIAAGEHIAGITLCCAKGTDTFYYTVFIDTPETTEIGENSDCSEFILFPNPASDRIYFSQNVDFTLLSVSGKEILRGRGNQLNVSGFEPGMYILKTTTTKGNSFHSFIKQ